MRHYSAEAIVLDVLPLHEVDRIVEFLTAHAGRKRGVAKGARRKYSRFAGQLQPLARVRIAYFEKEGRELVRIESLELLESAEKLQLELEGILVGSYLAEHIRVFVQEDEPGDLYYRLLSSTLDALGEGVDLHLAARFFECWVLRLAGVFPSPIECPSCGGELARKGVRLALDEGALFCLDCAGSGHGSRNVSRGALELLLRIGKERLPALASSPPRRSHLDEVEGIAGRIRRHFLQHELKSYDVMQRTLAALR